jgi:hypothetical protein
MELSSRKMFKYVSCIPYMKFGTFIPDLNIYIYREKRNTYVSMPIVISDYFLNDLKIFGNFCQAEIVDHPEIGKVVKFSGDQSKKIKTYLKSFTSSIIIIKS